jgi:ribosomal protein L11 methyltransferase
VTVAAWALRTALPLDEVNLQLGALQEAGLLGIVEEDGVATVYLAQRLAEPPVPGTWEPVEEQRWDTAWREGLEPIEVDGVTVIAPWHERPATGITLVIEPAQAFGTGHHETTAGCLAALQSAPLDGATVLDVGTGTGVLALAAKCLGAARVLGVDVDPLAVEAAAFNAALNDIAIEVLEGSADAVDETFDVVIANLDTATLTLVAHDLSARLRPGGVLIASGVSNERIGEAVEVLSAAGLQVDAVPGREWAVLRGTRSV